MCMPLALTFLVSLGEISVLTYNVDYERIAWHARRVDPGHQR